MYYLRENEQDPASKEFFILLAEPGFGKHVYQDQNQFNAVQDGTDIESTPTHFKRVQFDYESLLQDDSKQIVEVLSDFEQTIYKIEQKDIDPEDKNVAETLAAQGFDWIFVEDNYEPKFDIGFHTIVRHTGPNNRKFFALQSTNEPQ